MPKIKFVKSKRKKAPPKDGLKSAGQGLKGAGKAVKSVRLK